jgi:hypothetical protein
VEHFWPCMIFTIWCGWSWQTALGFWLGCLFGRK